MNQVEICNSALIEAHQDATITNIQESSPEAERCRRIYDQTRRELLSMYPWPFASKFVKLAKVAEDVEGYKYAFKYPAEALRINNFFINEDAFKARRFIKFDFVDSKVSIVDNEKCILCNFEQPFVEENIDVTREDLFPEHFIRLFYLSMALKIAKMAGAKDEVRSEINNSISMQISFSTTVSNREDMDSKDYTNYYVDVRG